MTALLMLAVLGELQVRSLMLPPGAAADKLIRLEVPAGQSTRVVFPEAALGIKYSPGAREHLGLRLASVHPQGVVVINPPRHPARGTMDFRSSTLHLVLDVATVDHGVGSEVRLTMPAPPPRPAPMPTPTPPPAAADPVPGLQPSLEQVRTEPTGADAPLEPPAPDVKQESVAAAEEPGMPTSEAVTEQPALEAPAPSPSPAHPMGLSPAPSPIDLQAFMTAEASRIDRVEGLAGQRRCTLAYLYAPKADADERIWLKFYLAGAGADRLEAVSSSWGDVGTFSAETVAKDLMVVVQAPAREAQSKHSWIELRFTRAGRYRFSSLTSPSVARSLKKLFGVGH